jgi:L-2-hydroxyglutarate oxidase LhgO
MDTVDCIVVGGGVVGLAIARTLALVGREVIVLEQEAHIGEHTSSRNSEVIHAGLHYDKGSLRQALFPRARDLLYAYCASHGVRHGRIGKLVVARTDEEVENLHHHIAHARAAGLDDLKWLDGHEARALEPNLSCKAAYLSPSSGIVDSHGLMLAYQADLESTGGAVVLRAPAVGGAVTPQGIRLDIGGSEPTSLLCRLLINAAAHGAPALARNIASSIPADTLPKRAYYRRGVYFSVNGKPPFERLIYPVHGAGGLDIHAVVDTAGNVRFGPDTAWVDSLDYTFDESRVAHFYPSIRTFWPGLPDGALRPAYAGIRPKITGPGEKNSDFIIRGPRDHGVEGLVHLFNIESPGLTSSLAISEYVATMLGYGDAVARITPLRV